VAAEALIRLDRVSKDYETGGGIVRALREVELTIDKGDFVAIVGASGSGKSTLMNLLGCLDRPTRGSYMLGDVEVGQRSNDARAIVRNRLVGFVFQGFNLLPRTTALENCELPLQYRGVGARERRKRAEKSLRAVGLGDRMDHTPNQLSGGQQQRVAIARALVTDPPLLLADEPTGNLDTRTSLEVLALLQRLNADMGITVVVVTHEADIAACARRVITMRDGRVVTDIVNETPKHAESELAALAAPQSEQGSAASSDDVAIGGPRKIPAAVYGWAALGGSIGLAIGLLYNALILDAQNVVIPVLLALVGEALAAVRAFAPAARRTIAADARARLALWYTTAQALLVAPVVAIWMPHRFAMRAASLSSSGVALALAGAVLGVVALAAVRFGLISLASLVRRPARSR
jgi:putative ABC transport system ATP-binding protein